jgi:hypothetical protein
MRATSIKTAISGGLIALCLIIGPSTLTAQSDVDAAQASAFMGTWVISMESDFGPIMMDLEITDQDGKVAVMVGSPDLGGLVSVTNITKDDMSLVLSYEADAQGQIIPIMLELEPDGEELSVEFEAADGQFFATGKATKS